MPGETSKCMASQAEAGGMGDYTSIRVTKDLADELYDRKGRSQTYEDVIWGLIEESGGDR